MTATQGPWIACQNGGDDSNPAKVLVAHPTIGTIAQCDFGDTVEESEANAALIANAPDMVDFIKRVSTFTGYLAYNEASPEDSTADAERFMALLAEGRALCAKATQAAL